MCVHAQVFVASYFSYMHIFAPHLRDRALRIIESATRAQSGKRGAPRFVVPHTHPGTCASSTRHMVRMCVDTDLACGDSKMVVPVPYVVSFPQWLVAERLPEYPRDTWLFFRGHLPKPYFDIYKVRTKIVETLKNEPNVSVVPANVKAGASYETHDTYLEKMLRAKFCINAGRPEPSTSAQTLHLSSDPPPQLRPSTSAQTLTSTLLLLTMRAHGFDDHRQASLPEATRHQLSGCTSRLLPAASRSSFPTSSNCPFSGRCRGRRCRCATRSARCPRTQSACCGMCRRCHRPEWTKCDET